MKTINLTYSQNNRYQFFLLIAKLKKKNLEKSLRALDQAVVSSVTISLSLSLSLFQTHSRTCLLSLSLFHVPSIPFLHIVWCVLSLFLVFFPPLGRRSRPERCRKTTNEKVAFFSSTKVKLQFVKKALHISWILDTPRRLKQFLLLLLVPFVISSSVSQIMLCYVLHIK